MLKQQAHSSHWPFRLGKSFGQTQHNKLFKDTPVVMLSSKDGLFDRARGRIVGSEQYLTKPFTKDELLGAIATQLG